MKPPPVAYDRPATEDESIELLARYGGDARILAGGQSLVPLMNFRLARPERLIDITHIPTLAHIRARDGRLTLGAATRQWAVERSPLVASRWPLLRKALGHVGHPQTRSRGTVGGSVAHADPAAELPVALAALDARLHLRSGGGNRTLDWPDFFQFPFVTACAGDEMLIGIEIPEPRPRTGASFREYSTRYGDFAVAGTAVTISLGDDGRCNHASIALLASGPAPVRAREAEERLLGETPTRQLAADAATTAAEAASFVGGHTDAPADYKRQVLRALVEGAILEAAGEAVEAR